MDSKSGYIWQAIIFGIVFTGLLVGTKFLMDTRGNDDRPQHQIVQNEETRFIGQKAESGEVAAMAMLAELYHLGEGGLHEDRCTALFWFDKAARMGDGFSQEYMSTSYYYGTGVQSDKRLSFYWAKQAEKTGRHSSQLNALIDWGEDSLPSNSINNWEAIVPSDMPPADIDRAPKFRKTILYFKSIISYCGS